MICPVDNNVESIRLKSDIPLGFRADSGHESKAGGQNISQSFTSKARPAVFTVNPEDFIWLELSLVKEVERVYVDRLGNIFDVHIIINERDPKVRAQIYARQKAIIDAQPRYGFDFRIFSRVNHQLSDVMGDWERPAYTRR